MKKINLKITGMHCTSCALNIETSLKKIKGIKKAEINFANGTGLIIASDDINFKNIIS
ncbi:MAG: heavy-metal-associated domain-containing protein, partial [Exilispira sp.]